MTTQAAADPTKRLMDVVDGTWPAADYMAIGPWCLRRGAGGGKRVSAASTDQPVTPAQIAAAAAAMQELDQHPLFRLTGDQQALDDTLAGQGYRLVDPVNVYLASATAMATQPLPPACSAMEIWEPLAIQKEIWAEGGIGPGRIAVMERARGPRVSLLGRWENSPAATAFVALHDCVAMLHALEVRAGFRGKRLGYAMMIRAAAWAQAQGAEEFSVICTKANVAGNALYSRLGMTVIGSYHYREQAPDAPQ